MKYKIIKIKAMLISVPPYIMANIARELNDERLSRTY